MRGSGSEPSMTTHKTKLALGHLTATPAVLEEVSHPELILSLARHQSGDWGDSLPAADRRENDLAMDTGDRILSAYTSSRGVRYWIITDADRSCTTALLPEDY